MHKHDQKLMTKLKQVRTGRNGSYHGIAKEDMIVWKAAMYRNKGDDDRFIYSVRDKWCIIKLLIKKDTRVHFGGEYWSTIRKCRTEKAKVLSIKQIGRTTDIEEAFAQYNGRFKYKVGKIVKPLYQFDMGYQTCASGIHFFTTQAQAKEWARS